MAESVTCVADFRQVVPLYCKVGDIRASRHSGLVFFWHALYIYPIFTARRNARIASAVLATAIPSVCPSVTRRYSVKTTARSTVQFALSDSKMLSSFVETKKIFPRDDPFPEILAQTDPPAPKGSEF